jgi:hypothetical protein
LKTRLFAGNPQPLLEARPANPDYRGNCPRWLCR